MVMKGALARWFSTSSRLDNSSIVSVYELNEKLVNVVSDLQNNDG